MNSFATVFDVKRFAVHDGPGIRTTLFLKGCFLRCLWCHNPESLSPEVEIGYFAHKCIGCGECVRVCPSRAHSLEDGIHHFRRSACTLCGRCADACPGRAMTLYGRRMDVSSARKLVLEDREFYSPSGGVTLSGGEPVMQADFCFELFSVLKQDGVHTALDTSLFANWNLYGRMLPVTDLFLVDVKHPDDAIHRRLTGQGNTRIFQNLNMLSERNAAIEIRIPVVPGCNDSAETMRGIGERLRGVCPGTVKLLPYHALARSKYAALGRTDTMPHVMSPSKDALERSAEILRDFGLHVCCG